MSALIGALRVSLSADTTAFEAGMKRSQRTAQTTATGIQRSLGGAQSALKAGLAGFVGALSVGAILAAGKAALDYAGSLAEVAQQLGVTARDLQVFRFAAGQVGVSQDQLETGLSKLTITLGKVAAGAKAPAAALNAIGISADQLRGKNTGEAFRIIADGLQKVTDRSQRAAVEVALFGKSGAMLDNLLAGGSSAINELTAAAEKLGLVLSDEQIRKADETADKLDALKTVLSANIAGAVADNAGAILGLANALVALVHSIGQAMSGWRTMMAEFAAGAGALSHIAGGHLENPLAAMAAAGRAIKTEQRFSGLFRGRPKPAAPLVIPGADIGKFLAGGGGGHKKTGAADHSAEDALRNAFQFDQSLRRAQTDVLHATQDLSRDYVERTTIGVQILNAEKTAYEAELKYEVELNKLTKGKQGLTQAQADQLQFEYDRKDHLERQKLLDEEQDQRREDVAMLEQTNFDIQKQRLASEEQLATTAKEQRDVQLQLLDLSYRQERARLEAVLADEKASEAAKEDARRRLAGLSQTYATDRQAVIRSTRGPLEEWAATVPQTAAQINEAIQSIEARGLDSLSDAIADVVTGTKSLGDAFKEISSQIIADIIRMTVKMLIFRALSSAFGGLFGGGGGGDVTSSGIYPELGFAGGGSFSVLGRRGTDRNILALNGLPIARVSHGERVSVGNGGMGDGPSVVIVQLKDEALEAKIQSGAGRVVLAAAPTIITEARRNTVRSLGRRRLGG